MANVSLHPLGERSESNDPGGSISMLRVHVRCSPQPRSREVSVSLKMGLRVRKAFCPTCAEQVYKCEIPSWTRFCFLSEHPDSRIVDLSEGKAYFSRL